MTYRSPRPSICRHHRRRKFYFPDETRRLRHRLRAASVTAQWDKSNQEVLELANAFSVNATRRSIS